MVILKKIKSATLIEALVATVLIVIIFMIASLVLNNLLLNSFTRNTHNVDTRINELEYLTQNRILKLPYKEEYKNWDIEVTQEEKNETVWIKLEGINKLNHKQVTKSTVYAIK